MQSSPTSLAHEPTNLNLSERVAYDYLVGRGLKVTKNNRSPDFIGDGAFEVKRVYLDKYGNRHVVLNSGQFLQIREAYPDAKYLFVEEDGQIATVPINEIDPMSGLVVIRISEKEFTIHWNPKMVTEVPKVFRMELSQDEVQKVKTCMVDWGVKSQTELVRLLLTQDYKRVMGSIIPARKK